MKNLYLYFLGGTAKGGNIEVHDVQFATVEDPKDAYGRLAEIWYGEPEYLHIDVQTKIDWADGYDVMVSDTPDDSDLDLYFVNIGGYKQGDVDEKHTYELIVADSKDVANARAKKKFAEGDLLIHKDVLFEVDHCLVIKASGGGHLTFRSNPGGRREDPLFSYIPIGINKTSWDPVTDTVTTVDGIVAEDLRAPAET